MKKIFTLTLMLLMSLVFAQANDVIPPDGYVLLPNPELIEQTIASSKKAYIVNYCSIKINNNSFTRDLKFKCYKKNSWVDARIDNSLIRLEKNTVYAIDLNVLLGKDYPDEAELNLIKQSFQKDFELTTIKDGVLLLKSRDSLVDTLTEISNQRKIAKLLNSSPYKNDKFAYDLLPGSGDIVIKAYLGDSVDELIIPETIEDIPVGTVQNMRIKPGITINKLIIPPSVKEIGDSAFKNMGIETLIFEKHSKIEKIGSEAFKDNKIKEFNLPKKDISIGLDAFTNNQFKTISIYKGYSFFYKVSFGYFDLEACLKQTENGILKSDVLEEVIFEDGCTSIPPRAFAQCPNLKKVSLPTTIQKYGALAFYDCTNLSELLIAGIPLASVKDYDELAERAREEAKSRLGAGAGDIMGAFSVQAVKEFQLRTDPYSGACTFINCPLSLKTKQILMKMGLPEYAIN